MIENRAPKWVEQYIGAPYEDHGRGPGYDCWGLVRAVLAQHFSVNLDALVDAYKSAQDGKSVHALVQKEKEHWHEVRNEQLRDVVLFRIKHFQWHVGIVVAPNRMLHILKGCNAVVERIRGLRWHSRLAGIYRHPSLMHSE